MRVVATVLVALAACGGASGEFSGRGGHGADWSFEPDRCKQTEVPGSFSSSVADLYYAGVHPSDTEVVVREIGGERQVLVRIPTKNQMIVLRRADCEVFDIELGQTAYTLDEEVGVTGHVHIACRRPEIGRVSGEASFTCF